MRILLVEDEESLVELIGKGLEAEGFAVDVLRRGNDAVKALEAASFDAVVLDIMLPGRDGLSILRWLRERGSLFPVVLISARGQTAEKIEGLDLGADDYLAKPFSVDELAARIRAVVRRNRGERLSLYKVHDLVLDLLNRTVTRGGHRIDLSPREFLVLECLIRSPDRLFNRAQLYEKVWNYNFDPGTNLADVYIKRIRRKIDHGQDVKLIKTVRGVGYKVQTPS